MSEPKPRKPRKLKETTVEKRLRASGALLMRTFQPDGCWWTYTDTHRTARADVCERLLSAGKLKPRGDGLFADAAQTFELAL